MKNGPYILILAPDEYPGKKYRGKYSYEHHVEWWKNTKILPPKGYHIHHRNGEKTDNRFDNLELIYNSTHLKIHHKIKKMKILSCEYCKKAFEKEPRNYNFKFKTGQKRFYCSRYCQVKNQKNLFQSSSVEEQRPVKPCVVGSIPTSGV